MGKMYQKLRPIDIEMLRALARDDDDGVRDAVALGANNNILVTRDFLARLRQEELLRWAQAGEDSKRCMIDICVKAGLAPPRFEDDEDEDTEQDDFT